MGHLNTGVFPIFFSCKFLGGMANGAVREGPAFSDSMKTNVLKFLFM